MWWTGPHVSNFPLFLFLCGNFYSLFPSCPDNIDSWSATYYSIYIRYCMNFVCNSRVQDSSWERTPFPLDKFKCGHSLWYLYMYSTTLWLSAIACNRCYSLRVYNVSAHVLHWTSHSMYPDCHTKSSRYVQAKWKPFVLWREARKQKGSMARNLPSITASRIDETALPIV